MATNNKKPPKKTGVNKGIEKGVSEQQFQDKVICKKCSKEIEFTLGSQLFLKCPRCNYRMERCLDDENKKANRIIKWDVLRRSKKAQLSLGFTLTVLVLAFNIMGFFFGWFTGGMWWLGLLGIPLLVVSAICIAGTRKNSASGKYRFYAWLAGLVNAVALLIVVASCAPYLSDKIRDFFGM